MRECRQLRETSVTGLEASLRCPVTVVPLLTSLPACLPVCLVLRSSRVVLHADERRVIQQENEKSGSGSDGKEEGRKEGCGTMFSLNLEGVWGREARESEVSTGHFIQIPSPQRQRLGGGALRQTRERHAPASNPPLLNCWECSTKWGKESAST